MVNLLEYINKTRKTDYNNEYYLENTDYFDDAVEKLEMCGIHRVKRLSYDTKILGHVAITDALASKACEEKTSLFYTDKHGHIYISVYIPNGIFIDTFCLGYQKMMYLISRYLYKKFYSGVYLHSTDISSSDNAVKLTELNGILDKIRK